MAYQKQPGAFGRFQKPSVRGAGEKPFGKKPSFEDGRTGSVRKSGQKPFADRGVAFGDRKPYGKKTYGMKPGFESREENGGKFRAERGENFGRKPYADRPASGQAERFAKTGRKPNQDRRPFAEHFTGSENRYAKQNAFRPEKRGMVNRWEDSGYPRSGGRPQSAAPRVQKYKQNMFNRFNNHPEGQVPPVKPVIKSVSAEEDTEKFLLVGRNAVREAIKSGSDMEKLMISDGDLSGSGQEIVSLARKRGIRVQVVDRRQLDKLAKNHQGMIGFASAYQYADADEILALAKEKGEAPFIMILDQITDPHNLGAIIRTGACMGVHGVVIPLHRSVGLTASAVKASAGAVEYVKVARVPNIARYIEQLQKAGVWVYAADMDGKNFETVSFQEGTALVIGSEGMGVSKLVGEQCDDRVSIPMTGDISSLNASVAAAILMYRVFASRK